MTTLDLPRMLLIAGTGRNSGKTLFAANLIRHFSSHTPIVACKISRHHHDPGTSGNVIVDEPNFYLAEETDPATGKDSSRLLAAGAVRSFYAIASDDQLLRTASKILDLSGRESFFIFESGGLRKYVTPGLFVFMSTPGQIVRKTGAVQNEELADVQVLLKDDRFNFDMNRIIISGNRWKINLLP